MAYRPSSKSKLEVEIKYGGHPFSEVVIKAQNDWSLVGQTSSCNAAQLRYFLVFTALHGMPARTSYEKAVCPFVCLSVCQTRGL